MMQTMKLALVLALAGATHVRAGCDSPVQLSTALSLLSVTQKLSATVNSLKTDVAALNTKLSGEINKLKLGTPKAVSLTYNLVAHHQGNNEDITIAARYACVKPERSSCRSIVAKAKAQKFNKVADYGDAYAGNKNWAVTIPFEFAGHNRWFTEPYAENFRTARLSLYWSVSIGTRPHPSPKPFAHLGLLQNGNGGYQQWLHGGPARYYNKPRVLNGLQEMQNFKVQGQSWGTHNYDDLGSVYEYAPWGIDLRVDKFLIANWGPERIVIKGMWGIVHGEVKYVRKGNTQVTIKNYNTGK